MSPALAVRIGYDPPLPALRDQLTQRMPLGSVTKVFAVFDRPFWRDEGLSGQLTSDEGPVQYTFDNSPLDAGEGILVGFIEGRHARAMDGQSETAVRRAVVASLRRCLGAAMPQPRQVILRDWSAEEYSRGGYAGYLPTGTWTQFGPALREPCGRLHWAGTETATSWTGYMEGAVCAGERVGAPRSPPC